MPLPFFIEKRFPSLLGWTFAVDTTYDVKIVTSGQRELRNLPVSYPRRRITVSVPADKWADYREVKRWYHALRGPAVGFRVLDPTDFLSIEIDAFKDLGVVDHTATGPLDQPIVALGGGQYQLVKRYEEVIDGSVELTQDLPILKPVEGTIRVANGGGAEQASSRWLLNYSTGILVPTGEFSGTPTTWGGQYDVPMRFASSLPINVEEHMIKPEAFDLLELPRASAIA